MPRRLTDYEKQQRALKRFRPRQSDALSFVFVSAAGRRLTYGGRHRGFVVYVQRDLEKRLIKPDYLKRGAEVRATRFSAYDLGKLKRHRTAVRKELQRERATGQFAGAVRGKVATPRGGELDFIGAGQKLARKLKSEASGIDPRAPKRVFAVRVRVNLKTRRGKVLKPIDPVFPMFKLGFLQKLTGKNVNSFVQRQLYAVIAEDLKQRGLVSAGSAAHVARQSYNRGKSRGQWKYRDRRGNLVAWEKRNPKEFSVVKITGIEYEIRRQR